MERNLTADRILLINKPVGWTSFDVVNKLRRVLGIKKIGHAGTLDPLASGLLIICTGKMTRQIETFMHLEKEYVGTFILGQSTSSHDRETPVPRSGIFRASQPKKSEKQLFNLQASSSRYLRHIRLSRSKVSAPTPWPAKGKCRN